MGTGARLESSCPPMVGILMGRHMSESRKVAAKREFLDALAKTGNISQSAAIARVQRKTVYVWREDDVEFAASWFDCEEAGVDALEAEAKRRALESSDVLLIFMLKSKRRAIFGERQQIEHTGTLTMAEMRTLLREAEGVKA